MRQLIAFVEKIRIRHITKEYYQMQFHAKLHRAEIPSLEEILGVPLDEESRFNPETDAALEKRALELFEERKKRVRQRT